MDAMRGRAQTLAEMYTTNVNESVLTTVRGRLDQLISDQAANGSAFAQASEVAPWGGTLRWTIRADLSRQLRCAEAPTHRTGTTTVADQHGSTTGATAGTSDSHTATLGHGDSSLASTTGQTSESTTGGSHTGSTQTATTGAIDMYEQQYDYTVRWTVTAGIEPGSWNPLNIAGNMFSALSGMPSSYSESGSTPIGSISVMNVDPTPHGSGGGGGSHPTTPRGPQEIRPGATSPHVERIATGAERHARSTGSRH